MEKSFASFLVEPIPVEKKLSTELKILSKQFQDEDLRAQESG